MHSQFINDKTAKHRTVQEMLRSNAQRASSAAPPIQMKLKVGSVGDRYEQEADRVASEVVRQPAPTSPMLSGKNVAPKSPIQRTAQVVQRVSDDPTSLDTYLENHHVSSIFKEYTGKSFTMESVDFLQAVRHFRKKPTLEMAEEIFDRYVAEDAPQMINLEMGHEGYKQYIDEVREAIDRAREDVSRMRSKREKEARLRTIFDPQYEKIYHLVESDIFPRFRTSPHYARATSKLEQVRSMGRFARWRSWKQGVTAKRGAYGKIGKDYMKQWSK